MKPRLAAAFLFACLAASPSFAAPVAADGKPRASGGPLDPGMTDTMNMPDIAYSEAVGWAKAGKVAEILERVSPQGTELPDLYLRTRDGKTWHSVLPTQRLDDAFMSGGVIVRADNGSAEARAFNGFMGMVGFGSSLLVILVVFALGRSFIKTPTREGSKAAKVDRVTFADVAGQEEAKRELMEVVDFLKNPGRFHDIGARVPRGVLLDGAPGNGKTLLAKAIAGEAGVPFHHVDGPEILEMFAGLGARRIRQAFGKCRRRSLGDRFLGRTPSAILFIYEIDTIGGKRSQGGGDSVTGEREQILNQLLVEMDGMGKKGNVVVIGATNRPDMLDPALRRPGRLDRHITVSQPDAKGRRAILEVHARKVKLGPDVDLHEVARMTPGTSGADAANLVNEAAIVAVRLGLLQVSMACFHSARERFLLGAERGGGMSDVERRVVAYHEAGHAIAAMRSEHSDPVQKVTIIPRGRALGVVIRLPERDLLLYGRAKLEADLTVAMGGRAAEELLLGDDMVTSGAESDIEQATKIARAMVGRWGMDRNLGRVTYIGQDGQALASASTMAKVDDAARAVVDAAYDRAVAILRKERAGLDALALRLLRDETLDGAEARAVVDEALAAVDVHEPELLAAD
jgi:cell division protease FtsH